MPFLNVYLFDKKKKNLTIFSLVCEPAAFAVDQQLFWVAGPYDRQHIFSYREHW